MRPVILSKLLLAVISLAISASLATRSNAGDYHVPSVATPTLQDAVDDAAAGVDPLETIYVDGTLDVGTTTTIGLGFNSGHKLLIRPGTTLLRATIRMNVSNLVVLHAAGASDVTIQDLDIFRHITNANHIVSYAGCANMVIQRCRVGSDWTTPGSQGWAAIYWEYPFNSTIRNTMTFATAPQTFACGMKVVGHDDPGSILRMYNNSVQGFYDSGFSVQGTAGKIIFRNNLAVTEEGIDPDPVGFNGSLGAVNLVSSHNAVFCDAGDEWSGADDIRGASFVRVGFADIPACFISSAWVFNNPNPDFLNLTGAGPIHTAATRGVTVLNGAPDIDDIAVVDDWEKNVRPAGSPLHTDRGADQSDTDYGSVSVRSPAPPARLSLDVGPVPARGPVEIFVRGAQRNDVTVLLYDAAGRLVSAVWSGSVDGARAIRWDASGLPAGTYFVRAEDGEETASAKVVIVR